MKFPPVVCRCGLALRDVEPVNVEMGHQNRVTGECPTCGRIYALIGPVPVVVEKAVVKPVQVKKPVKVPAPEQEPKVEEDSDYEWRYEFVRAPKLIKPTPTKAKGKK